MKINDQILNITKDVADLSPSDNNGRTNFEIEDDLLNDNQGPEV